MAYDDLQDGDWVALHWTGSNAHLGFYAIGRLDLSEDDSLDEIKPLVFPDDGRGPQALGPVRLRTIAKAAAITGPVTEKHLPLILALLNHRFPDFRADGLEALALVKSSP